MGKGEIGELLGIGAWFGLVGICFGALARKLYCWLFLIGFVWFMISSGTVSEGIVHGFLLVVVCGSAFFKWWSISGEIDFFIVWRGLLGVA
ncbi:hypothetical protein HZY88_05955 [Aerococcaceae bacterium DSM 111176]|nr:hypothetical protein [Aerococcaceae bacterium DSM 111176]